MTKANILRNVAIIACLTAMTACGGGSKQNQATTPANTEQVTPSKSDGLFDIPKDKIRTYNTEADLALALTEIPSEIFKGIGELSSAYIMLSKYGVFKYDVILKFKVKSGKEAAKALTDYYKSIGASVEEKNSEVYHYAVTFEDWGTSTEVVSGTDYVNLQLNVVKK
jgi:hypothetical protein